MQFDGDVGGFLQHTVRSIREVIFILRHDHNQGKILNTLRMTQSYVGMRPARISDMIECVNFSLTRPLSADQAPASTGYGHAESARYTDAHCFHQGFDLVR